MKIIKLLVLLNIICIMMSGCSLQNVKESIEQYYANKDIKVHTEDEMRAFALECLEVKYGKTFKIDESYCQYVHKDGHEEMPMILSARAYPEDDPMDLCGILVEEPNIFKDNYSVKLYRQEIEEIITPEMEKYKVNGQIEIDYPLMSGTIGDDLRATDIIYDDDTCICFYQEVDEEDKDTLIPLIRKWLDFLYSCDYDWYFALVDKNENDNQLFCVSKGDFGYTSSKEWSDERIIDILEMNKDF